MNEIDFDFEWNNEILDDIEPVDYDRVVVYSRDWTVETVLRQIEQRNIDLNPSFQRRNAWTDERRSLLIESLVIRIPVPEIVLAEDLDRRGSFLVIDGKQRLLTLAGFVHHDIGYWDSPLLGGLKARSALNGVGYEQFSTDAAFAGELRSFLNADVRCTVISNYGSSDLLYDIFYRLNTGSVSLSTQELRQVLNKGPFADELVARTNSLLPIHQVLRLKEPDTRLRDIEVILRSIALEAYGENYRGNMKQFLDDAMRLLNRQWIEDKGPVESLLDGFDVATARAVRALGEHAGRKYANEKWSGRFNRSLFEAEAYYFRRVPDDLVSEAANAAFLDGLSRACIEDAAFAAAIEGTTKTNDAYVTRFAVVRDLVNAAYGVAIDDMPVGRLR